MPPPLPSQIFITLNKKQHIIFWQEQSVIILQRRVWNYKIGNDNQKTYIKDREYNGQKKKKTKGQTIIYKSPHRKLKKNCAKQNPQNPVWTQVSQNGK
jgi:hypothetical protein